MTNYTDATENGTERNCARCDADAAKGSRFCVDHAIRTDGGTIAADLTDDQADLGDWEDDDTSETPDVRRHEVVQVTPQPGIGQVDEFAEWCKLADVVRDSVVAAINEDN